MKKIGFVITIIASTALGLQPNVYSKNNIKILLTDSTQSKVTDVVCKMKVKPAGAKTTLKNKITYYFCSESCKQKFIAEPSKYIKK